MSPRRDREASRQRVCSKLTKIYFMGKEKVQQKRHDDYDHCYGSSFFFNILFSLSYPSTEDVKRYESNREWVCLSLIFTTSRHSTGQEQQQQHCCVFVQLLLHVSSQHISCVHISFSLRESIVEGWRIDGISLQLLSKLCTTFRAQSPQKQWREDDEEQIIIYPQSIWLCSRDAIMLESLKLK